MWIGYKAKVSGVKEKKIRRAQLGNRLKHCNGASAFWSSGIWSQVKNPTSLFKVEDDFVSLSRAHPVDC